MYNTYFVFASDTISGDMLIRLTPVKGTHHGVEAKYLQGYLDEYVFRFNRRQTPMAAFQTLLGIAVTKKPVSLEKICEPESTG